MCQNTGLRRSAGATLTVEDPMSSSIAAPATAVGPITGPCAWHGEELERTRDWIRPLSPEAVEELAAAGRAIREQGLAWPGFTREDFPLRALAVELAAVAEELEHGRGIALLRGLPVERYSDEELKALFWGLGTHLGAARYQNAHGELIGEVRDEVRRYGEVFEPGVARAPGLGPTSRYKARSSGPLRFHTDRTDVVALLCVRNARAGGRSRVASSAAVSNAILARRPDLHALLCQPYHRSRQGEEVGGERAVYALPVFAARDGAFTSQYSRTFVEAAQLLPGVPQLTPDQDAALDLLAEVAQELCLEHAFEPGDIQLLNSHVTYHARTAYEDHPERDRDRLLLRLWLSPPASRRLPDGFDVLWGSTEPGVPRGGIRPAA